MRKNLKIGKPQSSPKPKETNQMIEKPLPEITPEVSEPLSTTSSPVEAETSVDGAPTHFDALLIDAPPITTAAPLPAMLPRDDFHKLFMTGFKVGHSLTRLQTLKLEPEDSAARDCSHAIYDSIIDIPALHFILQPQNKWFERIVLIGTFTIPLSMGVQAELRSRRNAATREAVAANDMTPQTRTGNDDDPDAAQAAALGAL